MMMANERLDMPCQPCWVPCLFCAECLDGGGFCWVSSPHRIYVYVARWGSRALPSKV